MRGDDMRKAIYLESVKNEMEQLKARAQALEQQQQQAREQQARKQQQARERQNNMLYTFAALSTLQKKQ